MDKVIEALTAKGTPIAQLAIGHVITKGGAAASVAELRRDIAANTKRAQQFKAGLADGSIADREWALNWIAGLAALITRDGAIVREIKKAM